MDYQRLHPWDVMPKEAKKIQEALRDKLELHDSFNEIKVIAGADVAFDKSKNESYGGVIAYSFPELKEIERKGVNLTHFFNLIQVYSHHIRVDDLINVEMKVYPFMVQERLNKISLQFNRSLTMVDSCFGWVNNEA